MANYLRKNLESVATHKNPSLASRSLIKEKTYNKVEKVAGYVIRGGQNRKGPFLAIFREHMIFH